MKKVVAIIMVSVLMLTAFQVQAETTKIGGGRGGVMGFIAGCCFGTRAGSDYNGGKEICWREWVRLIPYVNIVFAVWDGIDGANGVTRAQYAEKYGSVYY
ncbi:MAG TPA: hypothetical protein PLD51_02045 [Pontiellaceae bacterium]|nr:hypothetical protein [Pontiellaceae bacterium]HPR82616.1 hypothetical protein [Pontiellaceae bacterium]